ncbi:unnamed protein product, partial [marine sediment metagenome]
IEGEKHSPETKKAYFSEISKRAYPKIGPRGAALDGWFAQIYGDVFYRLKHYDKEWLAEQTNEFLDKNYSWMDEGERQKVINEAVKLDKLFAGPEKVSRTTFHSFNPFVAAGVTAAAGSTLSKLKDSRVISSIIIVITGIWVFMKLGNWFVFQQLKHVNENVGFQKSMIAKGGDAIALLGKALKYHNPDVRNGAAILLGKLKEHTSYNTDSRDLLEEVFINANEYEYVRQSAADAFGRIGGDRAIRRFIY